MKATLKAHLQSWMSLLEAQQDREHDVYSDYDCFGLAGNC